MDRNYVSEERQKFKACVSKLRTLVPSKNEDSRKTLNALLDEFNSLDYSIYGLIEEDAGQILCQACRLVPLQDNLMVTKVCQLIVIITHQKVNLTKPSTTALLEFVIGVSKQCVSWMLPDTLRALGAILYENGPKSETFLEEMLMPTPPGLLQKMVLSHDHEVRRTAILCVANACMKSEDGRVISEPLLSLSLDIILSALHTSKPTGCDDYTHVRFLLGALRGLQNLLSAQKNIHVEQLGSVLAALKSYSLYGLPSIGTNLQIPSTLFPSSLYQSSPSPAKPNTQPKGDDVSEGKGTQGGTPKSSTGRKNKRRGGKKQQEKELAKQQREKQEENPTAFMKQGGHQPDGTATADGSSNQDALSFWPSWGRVSSSESEYSDSEGGQVSKLRSASSKVRQASLGCLHSVVKNTDKRQMFGYWSAFIPDAPPTMGLNTQTLFTCMLKDPSPKARVASVAVIMALLDGSKQFLIAADERVQKKTAFTPFSYTLACTIKEIHRSLLLALVAESFHTTITQIVKCLSMLAMNVPYNHLEAGLLTRIIRALKPFFCHRDSNVRTACLTCVGAVLGASPPLDEVTKLMESSERPKAGGSGTLFLQLKANQSSNNVESPVNESSRGNPPEVGSPADSAKQDPRQALGLPNAGEADRTEQALNRLSLKDGQSASGRSEATDGGTVNPAKDGSNHMSWLVRLCSDICLPADTPEYAANSQNERYGIESLPVRIESLQVLTQMVKGYFHIMRGTLMHLTHIIIECLSDRDAQIQLHSLKVLEELGKALLDQLDSEGEKSAKLKPPLQPQEALEVWRKLLSGTLPRILQDSSNSVLQSCACDCLSTIGPQVFELLEGRERALCITLLLGLSCEEDYRVKAASVRALGVFVLYPCLRQDVLFVADTANAILSSLQDSSVNVRMRATWSLGNLSDALLINLESGDEAFVSQFSDLLLQRLFEAAIQASGDHDKVKSNAVRGLGMLVRFMQPQTLAKSSFQSLIEKAVMALLKNINGGAVKVRWNACYALGNMFRNTSLGLGTASWGSDVYRSLIKVITECKNFKVRINGALALSIPSKRLDYGSVDQFIEVWSCLVQAMAVIGQVSEISELKYRDTLRDQLCQTIIHLALLVDEGDLSHLNTVLKGNVEMMQANVQKFSATSSSASKPHGNDVALARDHLTELEGTPGLEPGAMEALEMLQQVFVAMTTEVMLDDTDPQSMSSGGGIPLD
ncbi:HEAT repeat-containing protein 6-like [Lytechinus variegatus]|uniref:HEAT repeat-containing protein 6-like n=1 Tax=Lytechinus variegatus TaxID=7654 RepID=UPI001BB2B1F4|nr:HEAT repeat-containing protein 6-like [Lytechinus variegatus]